MNEIKKFIYASSGSVYGVKKEKNVHEDMSLEPLTDYSKFKALCEEILFEYNEDVKTLEPLSLAILIILSNFIELNSYLF